MKLVRLLWVLYRPPDQWRGDKDSGYTTGPVEKQMCLPGLEEREGGSLRNLPRWCIAYMLARDGSIEDMGKK